MAAPYVRTQTATGTSAACPLDHFSNPFNVSIVVAIAGGTATAKVQFTLDDPAKATDATGAGLTWLDHATLTAVTATTSGNLAYPVRAVRTVVSAISGATVTTTILQSGVA